MSAPAAKMLRVVPAPAGWPKFARSMGLRARIGLLVSLGLLALIAIFVLLGLSALRASSQREIQHKAVLAEMAAHHLDFQITQMVSLESWAAAELAGPLSSSSAEMAVFVLRTASNRLAPNATGLLLYDPSGLPVASEPSLLLSAAGGLTPRSVEKMRSGAGHAVEWVKGPTSGFALVAVPVRATQGRLLGFLGAPIDFSEPALTIWLKRLALGKTGQVDVVDAEGIVLASTSGDYRLGPSSHDRVFASLMAQGEPVVTSCYNCHAASTGGERQRDIMAFARLQSSDWGVAVRQSEQEVLEPTRMLQQQVLGLGLAALVVALMMVWLTTRSILKPVGALTTSARRIAQGELDEAIAVQGSDELAELASTLEFMRERLRDSIEEIKGYNAELNRRVAERTADLERSANDLKASRDDMALIVKKLSTLHSVATTLGGSLELQRVLDGALVGALKVTSMSMGAIYLVDERTGEFTLAARKGISREVAEVAANLGVCVSDCALVARSGEPLVVENTAHYGRGKRYRELSKKMRCMVRVPFKSSGPLLGTMCLGSRDARSFSKADMDLLSSLGNQVAISVEKAQLYEELERKEKLRGDLLQKVISAQEDERKRIARELHDETSQALAALAVAVETATSQAADGGDVGASLARMKTLALGTLEEVHRLIFALRPTLLDDLGLIAAIRWYTESRLGEAGIRVRLEVPEHERRLGQLIETTLYRVVQEAVNNVANHSGARTFAITFSFRPGGLSLTMVDDGAGFDMDDFRRSLEEKRGLGLMGMKERVELLGGTFVLDSEVGQGTRLSIVVPLEEAIGDDD